jgi:hypothetical protein
MKAHMGPFTDDPPPKPDIVWVSDLQAYAPREDCELWQGREWRLRASCDAVRAYRGAVQPYRGIHGDTVRDRIADIREGKFPGG